MAGINGKNGKNGGNGLDLVLSKLTTSATIEDHLFRLSLGTIVNAHLYGHMTEAHALRAIVRAMRERQLDVPGAGPGDSF